MIHTDIASGYDKEIDAVVMERAALETLRQQSAPDADLTLVLTNDHVIHELNRNFLGTDAPTDVLSFPAGETDPETERRYLGDVIISLPRAREQAGGAGHPVDAEVQLLIIHGVLHLLGYDHAEAEGKNRMWAAQTQILERLGLENIQIKE